MLIMLLLSFVLLVPSLLVAQEPAGREESFFDWTSLQFPAAEYSTRREALIANLRDLSGGVFLAPSQHNVGGDTFRQYDNFYYFTGLELPNSMLLVDADSGRTIVFAPRRDPRFENPSRRNDFPGRLLADDPAFSAASGLEHIRPFERFEDYLAQAVTQGRTIWVDQQRGGEVRSGETNAINTWNLGEGLAFHLTATHPSATVRNAYPVVAELRVVKSDAEVAVMRRAAEVSARALLHAAGFVKDGVDERGLEAEFEAECKRGGSQRLAFPSIVKSGPNSLWPWRILASHYDRRNRRMHSGDLVIFDVGCELDHYVSDMGRTFPVSGSFTEEQAETLRMVTRVTDSIIAAVRPGVTFRQLTEVAQRQIPPDHREYMQTGLYYGHHLGLSTGDPNDPDAPLAPGMIFTVEPWYYNHDREIAVFVEDEVLVTEDGAEVLTSLLPRSVEELEGLVARRR